METRSMISFDWAMKRLLRQKANFEVLEGFLSELLCRKIIIKNIGESEGNKTDKNDKWNKVDTRTELQLTAIQQKLYGKTVVGELHPEYYIIKVNKFNDVAENTLDQWIYYLKNNKIRDDFTAQGIDKARKILALDKLTDTEKKQYWRNVEERRVRDSEINTALLEGETKGEARGLARGEAERTQLKAERTQLKAESTQLKAELKEKEEKEVELRIRIAELEQRLSKTPK